MSRKTDLRVQLGTLEGRGVIDDYYASSPDGRTRWHLWGPWGSRVFTTREAEIFAEAALAAMEHGHPYQPVCNEFRCRNRVTIPGGDLCGFHLGTEPEDAHLQGRTYA